MLKITPKQCRAARAMMEWNQPQLADRAGLGLSTVVDFEKNRRAVSQDAIAAIRASLEAAGVQFLDDGDIAGGYGVAMRAKRDE